MSLDYLVTGCTGLVGKTLLERLKNLGADVLGISSKDADLREYLQTENVMRNLKPKVVIAAAARVGGISYNNQYPVDFLLDNIRIQNNLMQAAHVSGVKKFVFLGSSCIYPRLAVQPIREESLMTGPLESTNSAYAVAKIAGIELLKSYRKQFNHEWISLMPTNIYGPYDNFNQERGHVVPALISRFHEAKVSNQEGVKVWGTGNARREFLFSRDLADAIIFCIENYNEETHINIGTGEDISVKELAYLIADEVGFKGELQFDQGMPDGTPRKLLDVSKIRDLGWQPKVSLREGIRETVKWYQETSNRRA